MEQPQVIVGERRYHVERFWGKLPDGISFGLVSTLAVAPDGSVLVAQRGATPVLVFDSDGTFRASWGEGEVLDAHGINVDRKGRVLLVDRDAHEIQIRSIDGDLLDTLGVRHQPRYQAPFSHPTSAFAADDGEIYVSDGYGNSAVHRFSADGKHLSTWGSPGMGDGEFSTPHSIRVDQQNRVLVADRENNRVSVFDREGHYIMSWYGFYHPMDICEDVDGMIYVSDQVPRLHQLTPDGQAAGCCRPVWNVPHGIASGINGEIFLTEMNPSSITCLKPVPE